MTECPDAVALLAELVAWEDGREQLVSRSADSAAPLTVTGHLDTVPADAAVWSGDPWAAELDGDRMAGQERAT